MPALVVDTHSVVWYLTKSPALSKTAESALDSATAEGHPILVPSMCLVELSYLVEKGRLPAEARQVLIDSLDHPGDPYELAVLDRRVADALEFVRRDEVPDLPDRVIAATALALRVPLVSRDRRIRASSILTIW
ncbi:MAG: PIN domain-containing protein [Acidobacteria bacterium]|nr:PIN domain-containing protein [Acidobacteriota bacterium]